jgi:hypothetical protein
MLDPHFEGMDCIVDHIGKDQATMLVQQYDDLVLLPLLNNTMIFFESKSSYNVFSSCTILTTFKWVI